MLLKVAPRARLRAYPLGAEGYSTDPGWAWYSPMASEYGLWSAPLAYDWGAAAGAPAILPFECVTLGDQAVVMPRPRLYQQHTYTADWTKDSGTWDEVPGAFDGFNWTVLHDVTNTGQLTSALTTPVSPNFIFGVWIPGAEMGWDSRQDPPYFSMRWGPAAPGVGEHAYQLVVEYNGQALLYEIDNGGGSSCLGNVQLPWRWPRGDEQGQWLWLCVCHLKGGVAVRTETDAAWLWFEGDADIAPPAGHLVFYHRGSQVWFSLCSLLGPVPSIGSTDTELDLTSDVVYTDRDRAADPSVVEGRYLIPAAAAPDVAPDLTLEALNHAGTDEVELRAHFTWGYDQVAAGQADAAMAYTFPFFPELYAVQARHEPTVEAPAGVPVEVWAAQIAEIRVELSDEAEGARATLDAEWFVGEHGEFLDWLNGAALDLALGWHYDDESDAVSVVMTGYADGLRVGQVSPNRVRISGSLVDASVRLRCAELDGTWPCMDGWVADDAAQYVCDKYGWHSTRADFTALAAFTLSTGRPEEPLWWPKCGQGTAWDLLERLARYCGCELTVATDGDLVARAMMYFDTLTSTIYASTALLTPPGPQTNRRNVWGYTGVEVIGRAEDDAELRAIRYDVDCESNPAYAFFKGYRRLEQFNEPGLQTQADVDDLADILYSCLRYRIGDEVCATLYYDDLALVRRQMAYLTGLSLGVGDADRLGVISVTHIFGPRKPDCRTEFVAVPYPV